MECRVIDFKNIVSELECGKLNIVFLAKRGIFLEDSECNLYRIKEDNYGSYLDKLIKEGKKVVFNLIPKETSKNIGEWEKESWNSIDVKNFMVRQRLV